MEFLTTDLCDDHGESVIVLEPMFRGFGGNRRFCGPIATLKLFEDNALVRTVLSEPGGGRVLVVDGGGSLRCALLGDMIGEDAVKNGWEGVIVYGCVRDVDALGTLDLGVQALGAIPLKSNRRGEGQKDIAVTFGGVTFRPGEYVYADNNGVVVSAKKLV